MEQQTEIWHEVKNELANQLENNTFEEIFESVDSVFKVRNNYIYLVVDNDFIKKRIEMLYLSRMNRLLENYVSERHEYRLITRDDAEEELNQEQAYEINQPDYTAHDDRYLNTNLNSSYTFRNFVVGNSNRLAYTSALKVADQPGVVANPLYIFGDVGLGKTHLMQGVGNYILEGDINTRVLYVKADQFVEDYVKYSSKKKYNEFNNFYRSVDVLLVDDIQFLAKKEKSQEEFFKLFELLHSQQKQIVITSDRKASDLRDIMARLTSRFAWGVTVDINRPDLEHRIKILEKKLKAETKHQYHEREGAGLRERVFANVERLSAVGSALAPFLLGMFAINWLTGVAGIVFGEIIEMLQTVPAEEFATSAPLVVPEAVSIIPIFVALIIASVVTRAFTKSPGM